MKILFVWPTVNNAELRNFLPLGIGYLAANLPAAYEIRLWDGIINNCPDNLGVLEEIKIFQPDVIGLSLWNFNLNAACGVADLIKTHFPEVTLVLGGPGVSGYQAKIFDLIKADFAFVGECEKSFARFLEFWTNNSLTSENLPSIEGLIYKNECHQILCNLPCWNSLEDLQYCDYELINIEKYLKSGYRYGIHSQAERTAPILTTRGCPFSCEYCSARQINGRKIRRRPIESLITEIKELHQRYAIMGFNIIDDNFTYDIAYAKEVCSAILTLGIKGLSFCCPNGVRVEYLDDELLHLMKRAGWEWLFIAPESGSMQTLKNMGKHIDLLLVKEKLKMIKRAELKVFGFFMIGYPGESSADIRMTIDFACQNAFDAAVFTCFQPLAGTPVYEKLLSSGEILKPSHGLDYYRILYAPKGMTISHLKFWRFWGLLRFYTSSFSRCRNVLSNYSLRRAFTFVKKILR